MALVYQIPRLCLTWILVAQVFLIAPHLKHLPIWIVAAWLVIVTWRIQVFRGHWSFPGRFVKTSLVLLCIIGLVLEYQRWIALEPMVGLLVTAFLLKLLEMHHKRDALSVIYIAYFVASTNFLFSQTLEMTAYILLTIILVTTALLALNQSERERPPLRSVWQSGKLILQCIPLTLVLFVAIPRVGSLWAVPQQQQAAKTGVSDSMSPGDFSRLSRSEEVAFRVTFNGDIPPQNQLYWRGLVFSYFDGRTWRPSTRVDFSQGGPVNWMNQAPVPWRNNIKTLGEELDYDVIIEPTHQNWLYSLQIPTDTSEGIGLTQDYGLVVRRLVGSRYRYRVSSALAHTLDLDGLSGVIESRELRLPADSNPNSRSIAQQWRGEETSHRAYINRVLNHYRASFTYTLNPPLLGEHTVDDFLWSTQRGFCEHFASSFVFMMRAAGIPARVVAGYQGGEVNQLEGFLVVKQADAHAWAEVWLEGEGWIRIDPTAAVAPERIELNLNQALSFEESQLIERSFLSNYSHLALINMLQLRLEVLNYQWSTWVVSYDSESQAGLLKRLLGGLDLWRVALAFLAAGALILATLALWLLWGERRGPSDKGTRLYLRFVKTLAARGVDRLPGEGPRVFAKRAAKELPSLAGWITEVSGFYESYTYASEVKALKRMELALKRRKV